MIIKLTSHSCSSRQAGLLHFLCGVCGGPSPEGVVAAKEQGTGHLALSSRGTGCGLASLTFVYTRHVSIYLPSSYLHTTCEQHCTR